MRIAILAVIAAIILAPVGQGQVFYSYNVDTFDQTRDNPASGSIFSNTIDPTPPDGWAVEDRHAIVTFAYTARVSSQPSTGHWLYQATWDGANLCSWVIETVQALGGDLVYPFYGIYCRIEADDLDGASHTLAVSRSILQGNPGAVQHETISYALSQGIFTTDRVLANITEHRDHTIEVSMHANNFAGLGFDGLVLLLFWIACIAVTARQGWTYAMWGAFPGLISTLLPNLFPAPLNDFTTLFLLFVMACAAEFWSYRGKVNRQEGTWS